MKELFFKIFIVLGFFFILFSIGIVFGIVIDEYDILAKEHDGVYPAEESFSLTNCRKGSERKMRDFSFKGTPADQIPVLTYHRIVAEKDLDKRHYIDGKLNPMVITAEDFREQMSYLKKNGFVTLSLKEFHAFLTQERKVPDRSVLITFDDGYKDNFIEAYPILKDYGFQSVNFIVTGAVTKRIHTYTPQYVQYLSLKELAQGCDVFEYQSHTYDFHKRINNNDNQKAFLVSKSSEEVMKDIKTSIFQLDGESFAFAYPYGEYSPMTIKSVKNTGFKMAFTTEERAASPKDHLYEIPRYQIFASTSLETFKSYVNN